MKRGWPRIDGGVIIATGNRKTLTLRRDGPGRFTVLASGRPTDGSGFKRLQMAEEVSAEVAVHEFARLWRQHIAPRAAP